MKLSKRARKAVVGAIEKWEKIVDGTGYDSGPDNCPLCKLYIKSFCKFCPIYIKVGRSRCFDTPYIKWMRSEPLYIKGYGYKVELKEHLNIAKEELEFLRSILKEADEEERKDIWTDEQLEDFVAEIVDKKYEVGKYLPRGKKEDNFILCSKNIIEQFMVRKGITTFNLNYHPEKYTKKILHITEVPCFAADHCHCLERIDNNKWIHIEHKIDECPYRKER